MLTVSQVCLAMKAGLWFATLDLENTYWHIPIANRFHRYLAAQLEQQVLLFMVLPFGLNLASRVFTKMVCHVTHDHSRRGDRVLMYLDDWLVQAHVVRDGLEFGHDSCRTTE